MVTTPVAFIITILFTFFIFSLIGKVGLFLGPYLMYGIIFCDENHRWDGKSWVDKDGLNTKTKQ